MALKACAMHPTKVATHRTERPTGELVYLCGMCVHMLPHVAPDQTVEELPR